MRNGSCCRIAAVVPSYNRRDLLERCLRALRGQTRPLDGIIVVDNASTDGTCEMLEARFPREVTVIRLTENRGSAGGYHEGMRNAYESGYDWIWLMDNDAEPARDALEELTRSPGFTDHRVGLLGSLIVGRDGMVQYFHGVRFSPLMRQIAAEKDGSGAPAPLQAKSYTGALIHRRAIEAIGLPPREYFAYQDDWHYTYRMSRKLDLFLVPRSRVIHQSDFKLSEKSFWWFRSRRWLFENRWQVYYTVRNRIYFMTRNARIQTVPLIAVTLLLELTRRLAGILVFDDRKYHRTSLILRAARDGFTGRLGKVTRL